MKKEKLVDLPVEKGTSLVGTFKHSKSFGFVVPDHAKESKDIFISKKFFNGAKNNDKVMVQMEVLTRPSSI